MEIVRVTDLPNLSEIFGVSSETSQFTPTKIFDMFSIPEDIRYTFDLKPMSEGQRSETQALLSALSSAALRYVNEAGLDIQHYGRDLSELKISDAEKRAAVVANSLFTKKVTELDPRERKFEITRQCVVGLSGYRSQTATGEIVEAPFIADAKGSIDPTMWSSIPPKIKESVYDRLLALSNLTAFEVQAL